MTDPIACRTVAGFLFQYADLLRAETHRLSVLCRASTTDEFSSIENRLNDRIDYIRSIAGRLYDQKGIIRDCEMLVILLRQALPFVQERLQQAPMEFMSRADVMRGIDEHTREE